MTKSKATKPLKKAISQYRDLYVRIIEGKGRGVFANRPFKQGEIIEVAPVLVFPRQESEVILSTLLGNYTFDVQGRDGIALGYGSLYNHSFEPNADYVISQTAIVVKAERDIKEDEEITIHYGWENHQYRENGMAPDPYQLEL